MQLYMEAIGRRCIIVNLDFANDSLPYTPAINVCDLITIEVSCHCRKTRFDEDMFMVRE